MKYTYIRKINQYWTLIIGTDFSHLAFMLNIHYNWVSYFSYEFGFRVLSMQNQNV